MPSQDIPPYVPRHSIDDYRTAADACFDRFTYLYRWTGNFWRLGHSFDTAIDYLDLKGDSARARTLGTDVLNAFEDAKGGHWYDDYGWWGLACHRAMARTPLFGKDLTDRFEAIRNKCWAFMDEGNVGDMKVNCCKAQDREHGVVMAGAPNVFTQAKRNPNGDPAGVYDTLAPRFPGGVWNCDWNYTADSYEYPGMMDADPCYCVPARTPTRMWAKDGLGGFQNTVTNALYYSLAARLGQRTQTMNAYGFFNAWIKNADGPVDGGIVHWQTAGDGSRYAFIRERVPAYKDPKAVVWAYREYLAWTGDQGLIIAAFVDYLRFNPADAAAKQQMLGLSADLLKGAVYYLAAKRSDGKPGGQLRDWYDTRDPGPPGGDPGNYHTGSGVFWRSVKYAWDSDTGFRLVISTSPYFKDLLAFNADAACASVAQPLPEHVRTPDEALTGVTNDLATLMAAIRILSRRFSRFWAIFLIGWRLDCASLFYFGMTSRGSP